MISVKNRTPVKRAGLMICLAMAGALQAAEVYFPPSIPMPANITEQYQVQGEYYGTIEGGGALGAWVVAKGNDQYDVKYLPGGLVSIPNAAGGGWAGTTKYEAANVAKTAFNTSNGYKGAVSGTGENRTITGTTSDNKAFTLTRLIRKSPTEGLQPKAEWNAKIMFRENNQADLANWSPSPDAPSMKHGGNLYRGVVSKITHTTVFLHIELKQAFSPLGRDQVRSNSGVYLRNLHEMQVLDSFGLTGAPNEMGGIYGKVKPLINAALPPLTWQTYDIYYTPTGGTNATITAYLNGVLVQNAATVSGNTEGGFAGNSLFLQNHDAASEVVYRNIWAVDNATTTTLPWNTILPTTSSHAYFQSKREIKVKKSHKEFWMEKMQGRDFIGRKGSEMPALF